MSRRRGFSLLEMIIVLAVLLMLTYFAIPSAELTFVKSREALLHQRLTEIREAIDKYKSANNRANPYPPSVADLVTGIDSNDPDLRRRADNGPYLASSSLGNPFTESKDTFRWDIRDTNGIWHPDETDPTRILNVYDIRFPEAGIQNGPVKWEKAMNDTFYKDW